MNEAAVTQSRRAFLRFLAGSPLLGLLKGCGLEEGERQTGPGASSADELHAMALPDDALSVFDLEAAARKALPRAHFAYIQTGVDGEVTLRENEAAFRRYHLRPRRLVDVSDVDTSVIGAISPSLEVC